MNKLSAIAALISLLLFYSCSTSKAYVQNPLELKGKKIGIGSFEIGAAKKGKGVDSNDTVCVCVGQSVTEALSPYLQQSGMRVVNLSNNAKMDVSEAYSRADSLGADYILFGSGIIHYYGKSTYADELTIKLVNTKTREVVLTASYTGGVASPVKAAGKMGEKILQQMK